MDPEQQQSSSSDLNSSLAREIEELLDDSLFNPRVPAQNDVSGAASSIGTTPDPLNTAFIDEETISVHSQHSQISLSQPQSQTTKETSSTIHRLIGTIIEQEEHEIIDLCTPTKAMQSTGTMPKTPTMKSMGTMPRTPTMSSRGTMPRTPTMTSTGTMPRTPTMASTSTMPKTPTMASTGTMPKTPTTIDLVSPTIETIDLCSPDILPNTSNTD